MYDNKQRIRDLCLLLTDLLCLVVAYFLASYIGLEIRPNPFHIDMERIRSNLWLVFLTYFGVFAFLNMNRYLLLRDGYEELVYIIKINIYVAIMLAVFFYSAKQIEAMSRGVWAMTVLFNVLLMFAGHQGVKAVLKKHAESAPKQHLILITSTDRVERVLDEVRRSRAFAVYHVELAIMDANQIGQEYQGFQVVADRESLVEYVRIQIMDEAYINISDKLGINLEEYIEMLESMGVTVHLNINVLERQGGFSRQINMLGDYPVVSFAPRFYDENKLVVKRIIDICGAVVGLIITGIVSLVLIPAIKIESKGPALFKQKRVGKNGRYFYIYKFRSMYQDAEARKAELMAQNEMKGAMFKMTDDPRVTKVGKFIRATSLDELPQFWNILKGDMSLVGTRPPTVDEFKEYEVPHKRRLSMKPGLTGMWQVSGRSNIEDFEEVVRLDCYYIDHWSLQLDAKILLKTVVVVLNKVGSK